MQSSSCRGFPGVVVILLVAAATGRVLESSLCNKPTRLCAFVVGDLQELRATLIVPEKSLPRFADSPIRAEQSDRGGPRILDLQEKIRSDRRGRRIRKMTVITGEYIYL